MSRYMYNDNKSNNDNPEEKKKRSRISNVCVYIISPYV